MRLSRLADFAVVLMTHMAQHQGVRTASEAAVATQLPAPAAAKVLARLCREGLLTSSRGVRGGYQLARPATDISVGAIINALDGPVALTQCIRSGPGGCEIEAVCPSRIGLHRINVAVHKALDDVSLADIAAPVQAPLAQVRREAVRRLPATKAQP
ncbi:RrF2 family transcriptional regulator [Dongia deserti]|uniref:RrF2 family transcriptional regulator n=1 Tax=Dongia deserti TaxID=2268030 RepID=UPI0025490B8F|nr:Rrf2 family transcriptional regulator [Dongia deserti]